MATKRSNWVKTLNELKREQVSLPKLVRKAEEHLQHLQSRQASIDTEIKKAKQMVAYYSKGSKRTSIKKKLQRLDAVWRRTQSELQQLLKEDE